MTDAALSEGRVSDTAVAKGTASDSVASGAYFSQIVTGLVGSFETPVIRTRRGLTASLVFDQAALGGEYAPNQFLIALAMTRRLGGPWFSALFRADSFVTVATQADGTADWLLLDGPFSAALLDETVVVVENLESGGAASASAALTDAHGNGATFQTPEWAGSWANLFSVQAVAQPLPGQPCTARIGDDPAAPGRFLLTLSPATNKQGAVVSPWSDVQHLLAELPLFGAAGLGNTAALMLPAAKTPLTGGTPGVPTPVTFRLAVE